MRLAINGAVGRIGKACLRIALDRGLDVVAVNDLVDPKNVPYLLKRDTVYGTWNRHLTMDNGNLIVDHQQIVYLSEKDPMLLRWDALGVDVLLDCTGIFTGLNTNQHIQAGAKRVIISAPASDKSIPTFIMGVNHQDYAGQPVISNSSCTSNCLLPVTTVMGDAFGICPALTTTVHSYTADQPLVDKPGASKKPDLHRARAAAENIVPTSSGAAKSVAELIPELKGLTDAMALRVPTPAVSLIDTTFLVPRHTTVEEVRNFFRFAAGQVRWQGILAVTDEPLVSSDFQGNPHSATVDLNEIRVINAPNGTALVKVLAWYDNEWGYASRMVDLAEYIGKTL